MPHHEHIGMEPTAGIEPAHSAWKADVLPLNYIGKRGRPHGKEKKSKRHFEKIGQFGKECYANRKNHKRKRLCYDAVHKMLLDTKQTPCGPFGWDGTIRTFV